MLTLKCRKIFSYLEQLFLLVSYKGHY